MHTNLEELLHKRETTKFQLTSSTLATEIVQTRIIIIKRENKNY